MSELATLKPAAARMLVSWAVAFPTITVLLLILDPMMTGWPLIARTFVLTLVMVPVMAAATPPLAKHLPINNSETTRD